MAENHNDSLGECGRYGRCLKDGVGGRTKMMKVARFVDSKRNISGTKVKMGPRGVSGRLVTSRGS